MTDITDQDRRTAIDVAEAIERGDYPMASMWPILARVILATVDAPAPTLAEELRYRADLLDNGDPDGDTPHVIRTLATRAEQMEHDLAEARAEVERLVGHLQTAEHNHAFAAEKWTQMEKERDEARESLAAEGRRIEKIAKERNEVLDLVMHRTAERDEAREEVERLTAERDTMSAMVDSLNDDLAELRGPQPMPVHPSDQQSNPKETLASSFKSSLKEPAQNPADVKPGEAWLVECRGERRKAVKDNDDNNVPWNTVNADGWCLPEDNEDVTLVSRLVPAPRVITNPDELDQAKRRTVILSTDGQADVYQKDSNGEWLDVTGHGYPSRQVIRMENAVTVLWEPGA